MEINAKMKRGFENLERILKVYFELLNVSIESYLLTIFGSVIIENGAIMRAANKYHNRSWFSDVAITMNSEELFDYKSDEGLCYGQVLLIMKVSIVLRRDPLKLALIQWYDFKSEKTPYKYGCAYIKLTEIFNVVDIEAIHDIV